MIYTNINDLPEAYYGCVVSDPPWGFMTYGKKRVTPHRTEQDHYDTMTLDALKSMPIGRAMAKDSVMIMWVISSHVHHAMELGEAWGLRFKSLGLIWCKETNGRDRTQFGMYPPEPKFRIGMGYYFRQEAEISLVFTKGKPKRIHKDVRQLIVAPRRRHSEKPEETYERVTRLFPGPHLDMFSRKERPGWDQFGNEVEAIG